MKNGFEEPANETGYYKGRLSELNVGMGGED